jgi:hypothetical protein
MLPFPVMPIEHIVALLIAERDRLTRAIEALQGPAKRRGRPPRNPQAAIVATAVPTTKRRRWTAAHRKVQTAKMKAYWAKRRKAKG